MWLTILGSLVLIILLPVLNFFYKAYKAKQNLKFYEKQGLKTMFFPFRGILGLHDRTLPENQKRSNLELVKSLTNKHSATAGIACNGFNTSRTIISLTNHDYIREFLLKEDLFVKQPTDTTFSDKFGFFFQNGEKLFRTKALFAKIFSYDSMSSFTPDIIRIIQQRFEEFNRAAGVNDKEYVKANLDELFEPIFERILNILTFGQVEVRRSAKSNRTVYQMVLDFFSIIPRFRRNLLYVFMPTISKALGIVKEINEAAALNSEMKSHLKALYDERLKQGATGESVLDKIIQNNLESAAASNKDGIIDEQELVGTVNLLQFAGTDTSQNTSKIAVCGMAERPDLQEMFDTANREIYDQAGMTSRDKIDSNELMNLWMKEAMRVWAPTPGNGVPRVAQKNFLLKDLMIRKGDMVSFGFTGLNFNEQYYPDPETFKLDRFTKENEAKIPKYQYIPFLLGKRVCLGRHMGELMVRLLVSQFCRTYSFRKPDNVEYYINATVVNKVEPPVVEIRLKAPPAST